jgi:riboflavin synthase
MMFSGIIEHIGTVHSLILEGSAIRMTLATNFSDLMLGESVAVNGVCLTVVRYDAAGSVDFFVSPETLARSNLGQLRVGAHVNLERSATLTTRLSGHLVQGHVDGKARLTTVKANGETRLIELSLPEGLYPYCVEKGSIALDGISLTLNAVGKPKDDGTFVIALMLVPHTWKHTNFQHHAVDDDVNVEVDVLAKYVERLCRVSLQPLSA